MDYRLLAVDLDDTLLTDEGDITESTKEALRRAKKRGLQVVLATGRPFPSAAVYARRLGLETPVIAFNGALIRQAKPKNTILHLPVSLGDTRQVIRIAQRYDVHLNLYLGDRIFAPQLNAFTESYDQRTGMETTAVGDLLAFVNARGKPSTKILAIETDRRVREDLAQELQEQLSDRLNISGSKEHFLEIVDCRVNKGRALREVAGFYGLERKDVSAVGDSYNDLPMLRWAGFSAAVAHARPAVKEEVDIVIPPALEGGIAVLIDRILDGEAS